MGGRIKIAFRSQRISVASGSASVVPEVLPLNEAQR